MDKCYLYETHLHTSQASACGISTGASYIAAYKKLGYDGIFVTDHFFNGNSAIPDNLPWEERIDLFCKGYEDAKAEGEKQGLKVFFGLEVNMDNDEYLIYGIDKQWLVNHPDIMEWDHITLYEKIKNAGGLMVQAHPFRERNYIVEIYVHPYQCDAFEVANAGNPQEQNRLAYRYAKEHGIAMTAGSDIHNVQNAIEERLYAMGFEKPIETVKDYIEAVKMGSGYSLLVPTEQLEWKDNPQTHLPTFLFDQENVAHDFKW